MFYWIYDVPSTTLALMITGAFVGFSWVGAILIRPILRAFFAQASGYQRSDWVYALMLRRFLRPAPGIAGRGSLPKLQ